MSKNQLNKHQKDIKYAKNLINKHQNEALDGQALFDLILNQSIKNHKYRVWKHLANIKIKYYIQKSHQFYYYQNEDGIRPVYKANPNVDQLVKINKASLLVLLDTEFRTNQFTQEQQITI